MICTWQCILFKSENFKLGLHTKVSVIKGNDSLRAVY